MRSIFKWNFAIHPTASEAGDFLHSKVKLNNLIVKV